MIGLVLTALVAQAAPPPAPPACKPGTAVVAPFAAWAVARPFAGTLALDRAIDLPVRPIANARLKVMPSKPLSGSHFASAGFSVAKAGRYSVAVGGARTRITPLWLDIAGADDKPLASIGHGHGQDCTSITKVVEFDLKPGRYTLLATGLTAGDQPVRVLIVRKP